MALTLVSRIVVKKPRVLHIFYKFSTINIMKTILGKMMGDECMNDNLVPYI